MPEYRRQTHTYTLDQLRPELARAIREHFEAKQITEEITACCETISDKIGSAWYDSLLGDEAVPLTYLALVLTPQRLIWARSSERSTPIVASAPFSDLFVKVVRPRGTQDFGLQLNVRMEGSRFTVNGQLLLGPDPAAEKFCVALGEAMGFNLLAPPPKPWWDRLWSR
ncbi:MAG: hypothetical protein U0559_09015 [Anaerolineae bacterium]